MYYAIIVLLMGVLPAGSVAAEHLILHNPQSLAPLIGKWFVFWSGGVRLGLAGLRQMFQPAFTARTIFETDDKAAQTVVQELGFGNTALAVIGLASLAFPAWTLPAAVACGLFYLLAGLKHATHRDRNAMQNWAMVSDLFVGLVLGLYAGLTLAGHA